MMVADFDPAACGVALAQAEEAGASHVVVGQLRALVKAERRRREVRGKLARKILRKAFAPGRNPAGRRRLVERPDRQEFMRAIGHAYHYLGVGDCD